MRHPVAAALLIATMLASASAAALELAALPQHTLDATTVAGAVTAAEADPLRFAVAQPLTLGLADGQWDEADGLARWRLRVASLGARSLSLRLEDLQLPRGASLRLLAETGGDVQGPYGPEQAGTQWLPLVRSDAAVLEVTLPAAARPALQLRVAEAFHGFRDLAGGGAHPPAKGAFGSSGGCNIDFACSQGDAWRSHGRAVVLLTLANSARCTGTLVNNVRQDHRPLILTANHCGFHDNIGSVRAYFNVQKTCCGSTQNGPINQNIAARSFLARDVESDFALFELVSEPPASFSAFYAGWDVSTATPQQGAVIHHPQGDDKKISLYNRPASRADNQQIQFTPTSTFNVNAWRVVWSQGTTEAGSSGAGLLNQSRRVVGVLSGGGASCAAPSEPDYFGRLDQAWNAQAEAGAPLRVYLDPDNSGTLTLDGRDAPGASPTSPSCPPPPTGGGGGGGGGALLAPLLPALWLLRRLRRPDWRSRR